MRESRYETIKEVPEEYDRNSILKKVAQENIFEIGEVEAEKAKPLKKVIKEEKESSDSEILELTIINESGSDQEKRKP